MIDKLLFKRPQWIFAAVTLFILWKLLLPGYVLTLDMVFTPEMPVVFSGASYSNSFLLKYSVHALSGLIPSWLVQKLIFLILFFCIGYLSFVYLPLIKNNTARLFAALIYTLNPFVYA